MADAPFSYDATARSIHASLDDAFHAIPAGKRAALLLTADDSGAKAMVAAKINGTWQVAAGAAQPWHGKTTAQIEVIGSW